MTFQPTKLCACREEGFAFPASFSGFRRGRSNASFPLTPPLSLGETEHSSPRRNRPACSDRAGIAAAEPSPWGEGRVREKGLDDDKLGPDLPDTPISSRFRDSRSGFWRLVRRTACLAALLVSAAHRFVFAQQSQPAIDIDKEVDRSKLIPISLSGFSGEVQTVLRFDLEIQGFDIVAADVAQFNVTGSNAGAVEGRVIDRIRKTPILGNRYQGGTPRSQAHAFADDIIQKITGKPGISRAKIAFISENARRREIHVSDYDGANAHAATQDSVDVVTPAWAPGGRKLFYASRKSGYLDIYSHDLISGERIVVAKYPGSNFSPAVSPDSRRVAMIISKDGNPELYVSNVDGTNARRLTQTAADESSPCWSPDGQTICVVSRMGGAPALYKVPASGGPMTKIRTAGVGSVTEPDWSPDGKWIAFTALTRPFQICRVPAQGGTVEVLCGGEDPSWAANSRTIVFTARSGDRRVLSLLDADTKRVKTLGQYSGSWSQPSWAK